MTGGHDARAEPDPYDAVVIGAGPAGGIAALGLARAGRRVLLVDKQRFPRAKVCGCCLNASAVATLREAELGGRWTPWRRGRSTGW